VGERGRVVATDVDARWLRRLPNPNLVVETHDITTGPIPGSPFDLIHARFLLEHLRDRRRAMDNMVASLAPGGWLLVEDPDSVTLGRCAPPEPAVERFAACLNQVIEKNGGDPYFGRLVPHLLRDAALADVRTEIRLAPTFAENVEAACDAFASTLLAADMMSPAEIECVRAYARDPSNGLWGTLMVAAWGRRPEG
jgi:hypothetical protein